MSYIIHKGVTTCFNPSSLPSISNAWISTTELNQEIVLKNKDNHEISTNSLMIELAADGFIVVDGHAFPVFTGEPLTLNLSSISKFKIIGAIGTKYRWIAMNLSEGWGV